MISGHFRSYTPLTQRFADDEIVEMENTKKYYFVFEGSNTEVEYFKGIEKYSKELEISNFIKLIILEKDESIDTHSDPKRLLQEARITKKELIQKEEFDESIDEFVLVFDRDSFKPVDRKRQEYLDFINEAEKDAILAVTSPCFEIWLLLHFDKITIDNLETETLEALESNYEKFRQNLKVSNKHTFSSKAFSETAGTNPKSNLNFDNLLDKIQNAIEKEKSEILEKDIGQMVDKLGSNIGLLIEKLRIDPRENAN